MTSRRTGNKPPPASRYLPFSQLIPPELCENRATKGPLSTSNYSSTLRFLACITDPQKRMWQTWFIQCVLEIFDRSVNSRSLPNKLPFLNLTPNHALW